MNNKLIPPAIIVIFIRLTLLASTSSPLEAIYYILSLINLNSDLSCLSQRSILLCKLKGYLWILIIVSLRSAITWGAWVKAFSLVGGGDKGAPTKPKGGIIC